MDIITYSKLKKCISVDINSGHSFATTTDRDTFFTTNPTQLKANMYIYCNGQLQQYINSAWEVRSTAIQGSKGDKGDKGDAGIDGTNGTNGIDGVDGVGIQSVVDNGNNTFTITLTNGTPTIIDKIDTINSDVVTQGTTNLYLTPTQVNKLTNIEENAEVNNISDANATDLTDSGDTTLHYHTSDRDRTNHTGTQAIATVTGLQTALDNKTNKNFTLYTQKTTVDNDDKIAINDSIDSNAVKYVTLNQLVSSVQDPHNKGYYATGVALNTAIPTATNGDFAVVGETNTIWVWNGTAFIDSSASGAVLSVNGRTGVITLTKADVGLDNVINLDTSTTANITDSTDKRFVTDANLVVLGNTSGTNTGDETNSTIKTKLGTDLSNKVDKVEGKSLIADTEITRLSTVINYDDSSVQSHINNTDIHVTTTNKSTWDSKANGIHTHVKSDITDFPTIPTVTNDLTNELKSNYDNAYTNIHTHTNKTQIDKIGEDTNGNLTYNGNSISANSSWNNISDKPFNTLDSEDFYVDDGVLHVNGGGTSSNAVWYPSVSDNGDISWVKNDSETAPTPKNIKGAKGVKGDTGANGIDGADGKSAYQSAIDGGFTGTESEFNTKLATAEQNVQADWNVTDNTSDAFIKNKPTISGAYTLPTASTIVKGGIKVDGTSITVDENGVASASGSGGGLTEADIFSICPITATTLASRTSMVVPWYMIKAHVPSSVIAVGDYWIYKWTGIYEINGGEHLTTVGDYFAYNCTALTTISLPALTTVSGTFANGCTALTTISLPALTTVDYHFANGCTALTTISLPALTTVSDNFAGNCTALTTISLPALTTVSSAFAIGCTALTTISLPALTTVSSTFAYNCAALTTISLPALTTVDYYFANSCPLTHLVVGGANTLTLTSTSNNIYTTWKLPVEDMVAFGTALKPAASATALTFGATYWNALSTAQKAIFTNKNYTITTA